jgi:hypothetical protein
LDKLRNIATDGKTNPTSRKRRDTCVDHQHQPTENGQEIPSTSKRSKE